MSEETTEEFEYINFGFFTSENAKAKQRGRTEKRKNIPVTCTMVNEGYLFLIYKACLKIENQEKKSNLKNYF